MSAWLKQVSVYLLGFTLALLVAGSASAASVATSTTVTVSPTTCSGTNGGKVTITPAGASGFTCTPGAVTVLASNISVTCPVAGTDTVDCNVVFTQTLTSPPPVGVGQSGTLSWTMHLHVEMDTNNVDDASFKFEKVSVTSNQPANSPNLVLGCQNYAPLNTVATKPDCNNPSTVNAAIACNCIKPVFTFCPPACTVQCPVVPSPATCGTATANTPGTDPLFCATTVTSSDGPLTPGACPGTGSFTRTWTATNSCDSAVPCTQLITIIDTTPPTLGNPGADATIDCPATPVFTPPTATDTCDPNAKVILDSDVTTPGPCPGTFTEKRTWHAEDCSGNKSAPKSQTITVQDKTPPTVTCPASPITVDGDANCQAKIPDLCATLQASDTCGKVTCTQDPVAGTVVTGPGTFPITLTVKDECGNAAAPCVVQFIVNCPVVGCTFTQGYYKNHESVTCGLIGGGITVGGKSYTCAEVLAIYRTPVRGNGAISLFHQLVTAKLNAIGIAGQGGTVPSGVQTCITNADALMGTTGKIAPSGGGSLSTSATSSLTSCLDQFNEGLAGTPHCPG